MIDFSTWKKVWSILDSHERRNAWIVLGIINLSALSAAMMVGSIMPFLAVLSDPALIESRPELAWAYNFFSFTSRYGFLVGLGFASFSVIVLSSVIQIAKTWAVARFTMMRTHSISNRLLASYLAQPYTFFLNHHSGEMAPRVLVESEQVVLRFLRPAAEFIAASLTVIAIIGLLLWVKPLVALISFVVLGGMYGAIYLLTRRMLKRLGGIRIDANQQRFRLVNESLNGIKDIKLLGRENTYLDRYAGPSIRMARTQVKIATLSQVPQFVLQAVTLGGIILLCLVLIDPAEVATGATMGSILPILGVFAFAGQRLMPELSKLYLSLAEIQVGAAAVDVVHEGLIIQQNWDSIPKTRVPSLGLKYSLQLDNISFSYPNASHAGLHGISLSIQAGEKIGIIGSTGAGKTTLVDIILGLLKPDTGRLVVDQITLNDDNVRAWMLSVGYVPQDIFLTDAPIAENIALGVLPEEIDQKRIRKAAQIARIDQFIMDDLPEGYQTNIGERGVRLSGGQRQRIGIARALYNKVDLVVFDEATSALDNVTEYDVMAAIDALSDDKTVLIIAHRLSTVEHCDRIIVLDKGRLVGCDTWEALMTNNAVFQKLANVSTAA